MGVIQPADDLECEAAVEFLCTHQGPAFLRTTRQKLERVNKEGYRFEFGKGGAAPRRHGRGRSSPPVDEVYPVAAVPR